MTEAGLNIVRFLTVEIIPEILRIVCQDIVLTLDGVPREISNMETAFPNIRYVLEQSITGATFLPVHCFTIS
jgi:hypothetical protein